MGLSVIILIVSVVSATCFAVGGYLLGRSGRAPEPLPGEDESERIAAMEAKRLKEELDQARLELDQLREGRREMQDKLDRALDMVDALERVTVIAQGSRPIMEIPTPPPLPVRDDLREDIERQARELRAAEDRLKVLEADLEATKKKSTRVEEELKRRRGQVADLQAEVARLTSRLDGPAASGDEPRQLSEQLESANQRVRSLSQEMEKERFNRSELERVIAKHSEDQQRLEAELASAQKALSEKPPVPVTHQTIPGIRAYSGAKIEDFAGVTNLRAVLDRLVALSGVTAAVLADDHGLLIEGAKGEENNEAIAAITTLLSELPGLLSEGVRLSAVPSEVTVADANGVALITRFFDVGGSRCTLAIATTDQTRAHEQVERAVQAIQAIL